VLGSELGDRDSRLDQGPDSCATASSSALKRTSTPSLRTARSPGCAAQIATARPSSVVRRR